MTREEFIQQYCEGSGISWDLLSKRRTVEPCDCGEAICEGWAMIPIEEENHLDAPTR